MKNKNLKICWQKLQKNQSKRLKRVKLELKKLGKRLDLILVILSIRWSAVTKNQIGSNITLLWIKGSNIHQPGIVWNKRQNSVHLKTLNTIMMLIGPSLVYSWNNFTQKEARPQQNEKNHKSEIYEEIHVPQCFWEQIWKSRKV